MILVIDQSADSSTAATGSTDHRRVEGCWPRRCVHVSQRAIQQPSIIGRLYRNSTTNTSPRQLVPMVQVVAPDSEPSWPSQSDENRKKLPSCETDPIAYLVLNLCELAVMKLCANRQVLPLPSEAIPMISLYQGAVKGLVVLHVEEKNGR